MAHIWSFSEESKELLQRCLDAAASSSEPNKWTQQFGQKNLNVDKKPDITIILDDSPEFEDIEQVKQAELSTIEEITDPDFDIISRFNNFEEKSAGNSKLKELVLNLPMNTIEKLNQHVFSPKTINKQFLERYFKYVLPIYIRRDNSRYSTDLLLKSYKLYPEYFEMLINVILKDIEVQNNILNDFILSLNCLEQTEFLNIVVYVEFSSEQFSHNLFNIYTLYKASNKTDSVQNLIFSLLKTHSQFCSTDKNFGKLLLTYLQQEKSLNKVLNTSDIIQIIDTHNSAFKRPCTALLKEINDNLT